MSIFSRKKQPIQPTGFVQFVSNDPKYYWVTEYIDDRNEIRESIAFADMETDSHIGRYTMPRFKKLVAKLHAQYLEVEEDITDDDLKLLEYINATPVNVTIRRIKSIEGGNKWSVQYFGRTVYYGKSLNEAYKKLVDRNPRLAKKFSGPPA